MSLSFKTLEREREAHALPKHQNPKLQRLIAPHLEAFNQIFEGGLDAAIAHLDAKDVVDEHGNRLIFWIEEVTIGKPTQGTSSLFPSECRERGISYRSKMQMRLCFKVNDGVQQVEMKSVGLLPIMVKSVRCHLYGADPATFIKHHEDTEDFGGYFVVNGNEKLIRLLIVPRRNHVMALVRPSFTKRGPLYSHFGTSIRCVRPDQSAQTLTLHYLQDGDCTLRFSFAKREYMIPAVLVFKSLMNVNDKIIFEKIVQGDYENTFVTERVEAMLRKAKKYSTYTQKQCLAFLGSKFQTVLGLSDLLTDIQVGEELLNRLILVHLTKNSDKFEALILMVQKLLALVSGDCLPDNPDSPMNHEILLPGHLYQILLKEKFDEWLRTFKANLQAEVRRRKGEIDFNDNTYIRKTLAKTPSDIGKKIEYFLSTGNLVTTSGLDLQQATGYAIIAEKLNFLRYVSHFRSVHRGAFFAEIRTTTVRKLLPESWGFMCPVHTPDGAPCGLLNHLSHVCHIVSGASEKLVETEGKAVNGDLVEKHLPNLLINLGAMPVGQGSQSFPSKFVPVILDGKLVGKCSPEQSIKIADKLRYLKILGLENVPWEMEICLVKPSHGGQYPGLFLFTTPARMMRPVINLAMDKVEYIGPFEQVYMDIAVNKAEIVPGLTTHVEILPTNMLSVVANITPFSDFNQSPRNMYQCQMGKQTMGTTSHSLPYRTDNKMYRIITPQSPIVKPALYNDYSMDNYPNGTNAIVAVISYTGYDMEDAMILNKSSFERGFGNGVIYQNKWADLNFYRKKGEPILHHFGIKDRREVLGKLDADGLPFVGAKLVDGDPLYCVVDETTGQAKIEKFKGELAYVEEVRVLGEENDESPLQRVNIKLRVPRPPIIGDKFSSRHGQKGVCSQRWPQIDMPFTESGMTPDVIINPHAFPSRMTIGMLIESMAAKGGALMGLSHDATPFKFNEKDKAIDYFGEQLQKCGYNYYGNEPMYSGTSGVEMRADIFIGVVYYQRLRHMVSDKFQVRTTGPVHSLTQQPVKGRKRAGGIRLGEMERDSLLGHGVSFILQDRLMNCSDYSQTHACRLCGSLASPRTVNTTAIHSKKKVICFVCGTSKGIELVAVPYVFRFLLSELMSMNIKVSLMIK